MTTVVESSLYTQGFLYRGGHCKVYLKRDRFYLYFSCWKKKEFINNVKIVHSLKMRFECVFYVVLDTDNYWWDFFFVIYTIAMLYFKGYIMFGVFLVLLKNENWFMFFFSISKVTYSLFLNIFFLVWKNENNNKSWIIFCLYNL